MGCGGSSSSRASDVDSCVGSAVPVGVGVGVGVSLVMICSLLVWLLLRERKGRRKSLIHTLEPQTAKGSTSRLNGQQTVSLAPAPAYASLSTRDELDRAREMEDRRVASRVHMNEMDAERVRVELGSSRVILL